MVCLAPVIWWAIKKFSWLPVICFMIIWIVDPGRLANVRNESWFFFSLGCLVAQGQLDLQVSQRYKNGLLVAYATLASLTAGLYVAGFYLPPVFTKLVTLGGVAAMWYMADWIFKEGRIKDFVIQMSAYSFFIFAAHEPLLGIEMKIIGKLSLDQWHTISFALYFIVPIFTIALLWVLGRFLKLRTPWFYKTITGGR